MRAVQCLRLTDMGWLEVAVDDLAPLGCLRLTDVGWLGIAVNGLAPLGCLGLTKEAGKERAKCWST